MLFVKTIPLEPTSLNGTQLVLVTAITVKDSVFKTKNASHSSTSSSTSGLLYNNVQNER